MHNFTVYSKQGCPFCTKVVQVLELAKLNHVVYKLGDHFERDAFYEQFGQGSTFPQVVIDGTNSLIKAVSKFLASFFESHST